MSVSFRGMLQDELQDQWDTLRPLVQKGLEASEAYLDYSPEDLLELLKRKDMQAWAVMEGGRVKALFLTRIVIYPKRKVLELFLASGVGLPSWAYGVYDVMVAFGKSNDCKGMRAYGREGWERLYRSRAQVTKTFVLGVEI